MTGKAGAEEARAWRVDLGDGRVAGGDQARPVHLLERTDVVCREAEVLHHDACDLALLLARGDVAATAGLRRGAMDEARGRRHAEQRGDLGAAAGLPVDHDAIGVAAEVGDILAHPLERVDQVRHANVDGVLVGRAADLGGVEEAQDVEAVIDGDLHDVVVAGHLRAFMRRELVGGAEGETAAVEVHHHWPGAGERRRPDVELEHVLAEPAVVPILDEGLLDGGPGMEGLRAVGAVGEGGVLVLPGRGRLEREPAIFAAGILAVGHALEGEDAASEEAAHRAVLGLGDGRAWRGDGARLLVHAGLDAVRGE